MFVSVYCLSPWLSAFLLTTVFLGLGSQEGFSKGLLFSFRGPEREPLPPTRSPAPPRQAPPPPCFSVIAGAGTQSAPQGPATWARLAQSLLPLPSLSQARPLCHLLAVLVPVKNWWSAMAPQGSSSPLQTSDPRKLPWAHPLSAQRQKSNPGQNEVIATT